MGFPGDTKIAKKKNNPLTKSQLEASEMNILNRWKQAMKPSPGPSRQLLMIPPKLKIMPKTASSPIPVVLTWPKGRHYNRFTKRNHLV